MESAGTYRNTEIIRQMQAITKPPILDEPKAASFEEGDGVAGLEVDVGAEDASGAVTEGPGVEGPGVERPDVDRPAAGWLVVEGELPVDDVIDVLPVVDDSAVGTAEVLAGSLVHIVPTGSLIVTVVNFVLAGCASGDCRASGHVSAPALVYCLQPEKLDLSSTQSKVSHAPEEDWKYAEPQTDCWSHSAAHAS
jgi:hypothetical protein